MLLVLFVVATATVVVVVVVVVVDTAVVVAELGVEVVVMLEPEATNSFTMQQLKRSLKFKTLVF